MDFNVKQSALVKIFSVYEAFCKQKALACEKGCAECCTRSVIITSLETTHILTWLASAGKADLFERVAGVADEKRFIPEVTINGLATLCLNGENPPEEVNDPLWGKCPFLEDDICTVYPARPFACRSMGSSVPCRDKGYAELDDFTVTVNEVFMQYIEHIDQSGVTGNLIDMLIFFSDPEHLKNYQENTPLSVPGGILQNRPVPALMIPPEHREKIKPVLASLNSTKP